MADVDEAACGTALHALGAIHCRRSRVDLPKFPERRLRPTGRHGPYVRGLVARRGSILPRTW